jgi:autotransporter passenger strand-loop-strand repeat protein
LSGGIADGVDFVGAHSTLALATPSGLTGFIRNWHVGDIIDFLNTKVTGVNATGNTLTVTYGDHQTASYSLAGQQANTQFALKSDGQSGTELFLQATDVAPPGQPFSPETVGTIVYTAEFGSAPSASELTVLSQFTQTQFDYGQKIGVMDPSVYAYQSLGVALATGPHFQNEFGPTNSLYPVSTVGDIHFVDAAYANVFGHAGTAAQIQVFVDQLNFFDSIYTSAGTFGSASNVDLLARGAVYGQMLGIEHENPPIGSPQGGTTFTAPPDQNNLVLNRGDILNVMSGGTATNTTIEAGAGEEVFSGGSAVSTTIYGSLDIDPGGMATNVVFGAGGSLSMASPNQLEGTIGFQGDGFIYATIFFPTTVIISSEINHDRLVLIYDSPKNALQSVIYPLTSGNNVSVSVEKIAPIGSMLHLTLFGPTHETSVIGVADGGHGLV